MQPPPRKGSSVKFLKTLHADQIAKLQVKNQTECELLEDLRSFMIKKSALEKSYCEAVLKITSVYLNKKITTNIPDLKTEGSDERWNMWSVWRTVLEENEKLSKARLAAIEVFLQQIADDAKILRIHKLQTTKKCVDLLAYIQKEVQYTVQEFEKSKKIYFDEEHSAHDVRDKAKDMEARLKRKKGSFFQSFSTLQKSSAKVSLKRDQLDDKSTGARNDYLLSLAAANSHQTRYFVNDLQSIVQTMESGVYDKVQEYFSLIGRAELLTCMAKQASYTKIKSQAQQLTREYNLQCLYLYCPVLKQHIQYDFERCDGDNVDYITFGYGNTMQFIVEEVKEWFEIAMREKRNLRNNTQKFYALIMLRQCGEKIDTSDPNGPDLDTKIDELQESIRKSEVIKVKTEAKIEMLRKSNDENVVEMCKKLEEELGYTLEINEDDMGKAEEAPRQSISNASNREEEKYYSSDEDTVSYKPPEKDVLVEDDTNVAGGFVPYNREDVFKQLEANWDTDDQTTVTIKLPESSSVYQPEDSVQNTSYEEFETPFKSIVLYNYTAQNSDELTIITNEELEVLGEGDGDGWLRARNSSGQEGFVPCTYLDSFAPGEEDTVDQEGVMVPGSGPHLPPQISFSSVDYTVDGNDSVKGNENIVGEIYSDSSASLVTTIQEFNSDKINDTVGVDGETNNRFANHAAVYCLALYDYEQNGHDELSFQEGQVIHVLRKIVHDGVDDGWWEGEIDGKVGLFPSLVVQDCTYEGQLIICDDEGNAEPISAPPLFTPPDAPNYVLEDGVEGDRIQDKFSFEISDNQHKQYNTQFQDDQVSSSAVKATPSNCTTLPDISISIVCDDDDEQDTIIENGSKVNDSNKVPESDEKDNDFNLGVTQIVITAPTPSSDSSDKAFPPDPAPNDSQISAAVLLERRKSAGEINEAEPKLYDPALNDCVDYPTTILEEPEDEEEEEEEEEEKIRSENPQCQKNGATSVHSHEDFKTNSFAECGNVPPTCPAPSYPQCVPEQLEPHQLQRLQQLKESNA